MTIWRSCSKLISASAAAAGPPRAPREARRLVARRPGGTCTTRAEERRVSHVKVHGLEVCRPGRRRPHSFIGRGHRRLRAYVRAGLESGQQWHRCPISTSSARTCGNEVSPYITGVGTAAPAAQAARRVERDGTRLRAAQGPPRTPLAPAARARRRSPAPRRRRSRRRRRAARQLAQVPEQPEPGDVGRRVSAGARAASRRLALSSSSPPPRPPRRARSPLDRGRDRAEADRLGEHEHVAGPGAGVGEHPVGMHGARHREAVLRLGVVDRVAAGDERAGVAQRRRRRRRARAQQLERQAPRAARRPGSARAAASPPIA